MNQYIDYLERWTERHGEETTAVSPYWAEGTRLEVRIEQLTPTEHDELWLRLLSLYQEWSSSGHSDCLTGVMSLVETELLVRGRFMSPADLVRPQPKPAKRKGRGKKKDVVEGYTGYF